METIRFTLLSIILFLFLCYSHHLVSPHSDHESHGPSSLYFPRNLVGSQKGQTVKGISEVKKYLERYGYLTRRHDGTNHDDHFDRATKSAIKTYQKFFRLKVTGRLDAETLAMMEKPRCGHPDLYFKDRTRSKSPHHNMSSSSKFAFFPGEPKWNKTKLTFAYHSHMGVEGIFPILFAIRDWANATGDALEFSFIYGGFYIADLKFSFETGDHGDGSPFAPNILAHAFRPPDGRVHFNAQVKWGNKKHAFRIKAVALHEIGHALGLAHSTDPRSIMWPTIAPGKDKDLAADDVSGLKSLYKI